MSDHSFTGAIDDHDQVFSTVSEGEGDDDYDNSNNNRNNNNNNSNFIEMNYHSRNKNDDDSSNEEKKNKKKNKSKTKEQQRHTRELQDEQKEKDNSRNKDDDDSNNDDHHHRSSPLYNPSAVKTAKMFDRPGESEPEGLPGPLLSMYRMLFAPLLRPTDTTDSYIRKVIMVIAGTTGFACIMFGIVWFIRAGQLEDQRQLPAILLMAAASTVIGIIGSSSYCYARYTRRVSAEHLSYTIMIAEMWCLVCALTIPVMPTLINAMTASLAGFIGRTAHQPFHFVVFLVLMFVGSVNTATLNQHGWHPWTLPFPYRAGPAEELAYVMMVVLIGFFVIVGAIMAEYGAHRKLEARYRSSTEMSSQFVSELQKWDLAAVDRTLQRFVDKPEADVDLHHELGNIVQTVRDFAVYMSRDAIDALVKRQEERRLILLASGSSGSSSPSGVKKNSKQQQQKSIQDNNNSNRDNNHDHNNNNSSKSKNDQQQQQQEEEEDQQQQRVLLGAPLKSHRRVTVVVLKLAHLAEDIVTEFFRGDEQVLCDLLRLVCDQTREIIHELGGLMIDFDGVHIVAVFGVPGLTHHYSSGEEEERGKEEQDGDESVSDNKRRRSKVSSSSSCSCPSNVDAERTACVAALSIFSMLRDVVEPPFEHYGVLLSPRVAVHSGPLLVGPVGCEQRTIFTASGPALQFALAMLQLPTTRGDREKNKNNQGNSHTLLSSLASASAVSASSALIPSNILVSETVLRRAHVQCRRPRHRSEAPFSFVWRDLLLAQETPDNTRSRRTSALRHNSSRQQQREQQQEQQEPGNVMICQLLGVVSTVLSAATKNVNHSTVSSSSLSAAAASPPASSPPPPPPPPAASSVFLSPAERDAVSVAPSTFSPPTAPEHSPAVAAAAAAIAESNVRVGKTSAFKRVVRHFLADARSAAILLSLNQAYRAFQCTKFAQAADIYRGLLSDYAEGQNWSWPHFLRDYEIRASFVEVLAHRTSCVLYESEEDLERLKRRKEVLKEKQRRRQHMKQEGENSSRKNKKHRYPDEGEGDDNVIPLAFESQDDLAFDFDDDEEEGDEEEHFDPQRFLDPLVLLFTE